MHSTGEVGGNAPELVLASIVGQHKMLEEVDALASNEEINAGQAKRHTAGVVVELQYSDVIIGGPVGLLARCHVG